MSKMPNYVSTTNACKLCEPLGASIVFRGIEGAVPFLHGSQGCATYMRRYIISHFNEPIDIASSSLGEKNAIYGGGPNLKLGLKNVTEKYQPDIIGVATTCLTETIGDDVNMLISEYKAEFQADGKGPLIFNVSTPSYSGTHMEGFNAALKGAVEQLIEPGEPNDSVNVLGGFVSAADLRYYKEVLEAFELDYTLLPDYSETLDGEALDDYPLLPKGGTPIASIKRMGGARLTIECGSTLLEKSAGTSIEKQHGVPLYQTALPIGIRATDRFFEKLEELSGKATPAKYASARGRLIDAMVDGHKYIYGKRAVVYGEEDLVVGVAALLAEIGVHPVLCATGGKSGQLKKAVTEVLEGMNVPEPEVKEDVDFFDIEGLAKSLDVDMLVGHSKGYTFSRKENIPLIRVGFPIHDRVGGQRILHLGYEGAQHLFDLVTNTMIEKKQADSPVGYTYM